MVSCCEGEAGKQSPGFQRENGLAGAVQQYFLSKTNVTQGFLIFE